MKTRWAMVLVVGFAVLAAMADEPVDVRIGQTPGGPRIFVDGKAARPRFFYGSPTCLCNISSPRKTVLKIPFAADRDTSHGRIALDGYPGVDPIWYSDAKLVDLTVGTTNVVQMAAEETNTLHYVADGLTFRKGHRYHYVFTHRATRPRTYFMIEVSYAEDGHKTKLPYYYGDTLGDTVALAATAEVDFVTFSTDSSWGCEGWWNPPEESENYAKIDSEFARLLKINPKALLVPRIMTDAPAWMHARHPDLRMIYEPHCSLEISSVSSRPYRQAACAAVEKLSRHLREKFPRNYAGLQISGQNSAEWFYMLSQSEYLSGYDPATRNAFREWLKARGDRDWATAEVPTYAERRKAAPPPRVVEFARFRNREMASFLVELGAAAKRGSGGHALTFFFYGYSWELGGATAAETGHFDFGWLMKNAHGKIDAFSSPLSYSSRNLTGSTVMMSAAESVLRNGYLWFNEIDHRTHHEEMWDHMALFTPYSDPNVTREIFLRDSAADILRGYGDWWMDLFGRGWFRDKEIWKVRSALNRLDDLIVARNRPYMPQIASVVNEDSFLCGGWDTRRSKLRDRKGFATCGADYGQYLLSDVLENPPASVKLFYLTIAGNLAPNIRAKLDALKAARPDATFVENVTPEDITAEAIAARAAKAGVHRFTAPGAANVCSAEGIVLVQALKEGPLEIDFGSCGPVRDALTGAVVCNGPKAVLQFRLGETRLFCREEVGRRTSFANVEDRVCKITSVSEVGGKGPYTQVDFTLRPEKGSEILCRMALPPPSRWNGELWGVGNSSLGGTIPEIAHYAQSGCAVATTDLGTRRYVSGDLKGEYLSDAVVRDYSWRATHFMTVYGKRIVQSFYGRPYARAYFIGGSCGGRQGLCEAMRYPEDYDGIIAYIPAGPVVANAFQTLHRYRTTHDENGNALVTPQQLSILADAPIEYMKGKEPEPYNGNFLSCPFAFTPADVEGVIDVAAKKDPALGAPKLRARLREFFLGLSQDGRILCHGILPGTRQGNPKGGSYRRAVSRYFGRPDNATYPTFEWLARTAAERGGVMNAASFDLSAFRDRGGKLFVTVGLEDQTTHTPSMIAWYEMMCARMGGLAEAQKFCRLFAMPGVAHGGGKGRVKRVDNALLVPLVRAWVKNGKAPESMPLAIPSGVTIPVPPYPLMTYKDGSGAWQTKAYPKGAVRHPDPSLFNTDLEPWKRSGVDKEPPAPFDVTRYGALPDGSSDSTAALQRAIDECAAAGGGTVVVPPGGVYVSRRLSLRSNVELRIDEGATIRCSDEIEKFPRYEPTDVWRWDRPVRWNSYAFFYTCGQTNVAITGKGTIDGNSTSERFHVRVDGAYLRTSDTNIVARGLFFAGCRGVRIEGIRYVNPCGWATWFLDCDDVRVRNVTIRCDRERPNGDGLHFGGCRDVSVSECDIDANDDAIIVRSHQEQMRAPRPCERVRVENCRLRSNQYAVRFGWTCDAPVKDCVFRNIDCPYSNRGLGFALPRMFDPSYTRDPPRGNGIPEPDFPTVPFALENIRFENMRLTSFTIPFGIMVGACERVAYMRNVCFSNCQFRAQLPPVFKFRQQDRVSDWRFVDVDFRIEKPKGSLTPDMGVWFDNAEDIVMERVRWRCVPRDDPEWRITLRAIANGKWERYRDPKTKYINLRPCAKPKPTLPFEVAGAKLRPRVETTPDGARQFVYDELTDGIFVWKVRVTLVERVAPTGRRWTVNIENRDPGLDVLGFEGPWERFGDFQPLTSSLSVCGTQVKDFPESGMGLERISTNSVGWVSAGDRDLNRRKEADMRVTEERGRAVYASPWGESPEARIDSGSHSVSVGGATGGTARRVMLRYDHEYGLLDWCLGYRVMIRHGGSASLEAAATHYAR